MRDHGHLLAAEQLSDRVVVIYTVTVPYAAIALTLYYFALEARRDTTLGES